MIIINTISDNRFTFNGVTYFRNFTPFVTGNKVSIVNAYNSCVSLTDTPTIFSDFVVDGVTYPSVNALQVALLPVVYTRSSLLGFTPENVANKSTNLTSPDNTKYPTTLAVSTALSGKQNTLTNPITGTGTTNYLPKFTGSTTLANSLIFDNGTNVGIGTTSPTAKLHVADTNKVFDTYGNINVFTTNTAAADIGGSIALGGTNTTTGTNPYVFGKIQGIKEGSASGWNGALLLGTTNSNSSISEKMRITSAGNVGISTASPGARLDVRAQGALSTDIAFRVRNSANDNDLIRVQGNGNVGIATTTPTSRLQVVGLPAYADNATAIAGGLTVGAFYHTAGILKVVI